MKRRLLSLLLALVMVVAILPMPISMATGEDTPPQTEEEPAPSPDPGDTDGEGLLRSHLRNITHPTHLNEGRLSIADMIRRDPNPGLLSFVKGEAVTTGDVTLKDWSVSAEGEVRFTLSGGKDGDTVTLPITIHSEVHGSDTLEVIITLGYSKLTITSAATVVYGETLQLTCLGLTGTGALIFSVVNGGEFAKINGDVLIPLKAGSVTIKAMQVTDGANPTQESDPVTITIEKATPTGTPRYTALTRAGLTLADAMLVNSTFTVPGKLEWVLPDSTAVVANVAYEWIFTPDDFDNYSCVTGMIIPYVVTDNVFAIGEGTTVLNSDGSYTTTAFGEDDSRYELTEWPDGKMRMVHRQLDGTIVTTVLETDNTRTQTIERPDDSTEITSRLPDGTIYNVSEDKYGRVSVQISLPYYVTYNASKNGSTIELPIPEIPYTDNRADAPVILFSMSSKHTVRVSIPINSPGAGTVAILIAKNGQESVVRSSTTGRDALYVTLTGSGTVKVADLGKRFNDVSRNDWFSDAAAFVTSRGLFQGMDAVTFAPGETMSRAMLVQVLHNLEGNPNYGISYAFSDTPGTWYAVPASWATYCGYISGYPDGTFRGEDNITREQLALILYRYAGYPSTADFVNTPIFDYYDYGEISSYAWDAMYWAVNSGVLYTDGSTHLSPGKDATRAEVAQTIQNLVEYLNR